MVGNDWTELRSREVIHEGPRTTLYRVTRAGDDALAILKVLKTSSDDAQNRARLEHEMDVMSRVNDAGTIRAHGLTTYDGRLALALEDFGGQDLTHALPRSPSIDLVVRIGIGAARSLAAVHRANVVHRDIKPSNILYRASSGELKLADFGIATVTGEVETRGLVLEGTLPYIAPEQTGRMRRPVDRRADLYALGIVLYELLTGQRPFHARDALEWMHRHIAQIPTPPSEVAPRVPAILSSIVLELLAKSPEERYQTAEGLQHDLQRFFDGEHTFPLREHDVSDRFAISGRVYGRDSEIAAMQAAFERVASSGKPELVVVSGYSGIGKSSLVRELEPAVARHDAFFATGKFDQLRQHVPYSAFAQAGNELVRQLSTASGARLEAFRVALEESLHGAQGVLVDVFPEITALLGPRSNIRELSPGAAQNRLQAAVRAFLRAFGAPVVLFLDDLQWADQASLDLIEAVCGGSESAFLGIFAYRDNEVGMTHPLAALLDRLHARGTPPIESIILHPLRRGPIEAMVGDTLHASSETSASLAALVLDKTQGNPFFANEFLRTLHLDGLLRFDGEKRTWQFDQPEVERRNISDNVVELMLGRLHGLSATSRELLRIAACIGTEFAIDDLAALTGTTVIVATEALREPIERGLIAAHPDREGHVVARFLHDRIQQAAYALTEVGDKPATHLKIGRHLWKGLEEDSRASRIFEVANHLDVAYALIVDPVERERLLSLYRAAAQKAKATTAYSQASQYLSRAADLLGIEGFERRYAITFDVHVERAECEYLAGRLDGARRSFVELLERAQSTLDRARIYYLQIRMLQVAGDFSAATALCLQSFRLFGLSPADTDAEAAVATEQEHRIAEQLLGDRAIESLLDAPPMTDPDVRMLVALLEASGPPIYMVRPALFGWVALQLVNLSLRHGNAEASCYGYGIYALLRAAVMGDVEGGYRFSELAIALNAKLGDQKLEGCMLHLLGDHVNFWKNPIASDLPILERGFAACVRGGDHIYSNYIGFQSPWHLYESGAPLADVNGLIEKYSSFARDSSYDAVLWTLRVERRFIRTLQGPSAARADAPDEELDKSVALAEIVKAQFGCGIVYFHILEMIERYTFGDYAKALESSVLAAAELGAAFSMPIYVTFGLYQALTLATQYADADGATREKHLVTMRAHHASMTRWAKRNPANFAHYAALIGAEIARVTGDIGSAMRLYEQSRLAARAQGMPQYEALACELAAGLYEASGVASVARALWVDAYALYRSWGAESKAADLLARHRGIDASKRTATRSLELTTQDLSTTGITTTGQLDVVSVLKASQSISAEIVLPKLLERLMSIVIEYAGAARGWLVLLEGEALTVAAEADIGREVEPWTTNVAIEPNVLPLSILEYVRRTDEPVLVEDAQIANRFASDPYFAIGKHRSILCKPIRRQQRLIGMFYLENALVAGAFGSTRLAVLDVLATQTAISIENSRLYQASQQAVVARDEFLSIASHELKTPLTPLTIQLHRLTSAIRKGRLQDFTDDKLASMANLCDAQIIRITRLVGALLDVSRIGSGRLLLQREPVDLGTLVSEVVARHSAESSAAGCHVTVEVAGVATGSWDKMRLEQIVSNLLLNALKFGRAQPIELRVSQVGLEARLDVRDRGVGIRVEDRARIFERFERVRSDTNVDGLGLGLFIVRAILAAHGGRIAVEAPADGGTCFRVMLPTRSR